jgi:hypothetical protein
MYSLYKLNIFVNFLFSFLMKILFLLKLIIERKNKHGVANYIKNQTNNS